MFDFQTSQSVLTVFSLEYKRNIIGLTSGQVQRRDSSLDLDLRVRRLGPRIPKPYPLVEMPAHYGRADSFWRDQVIATGPGELGLHACWKKNIYVIRWTSFVRFHCRSKKTDRRVEIRSRLVCGKLRSAVIRNYFVHKALDLLEKKIHEAQKIPEHQFQKLFNLILILPTIHWYTTR